MGNSGSDDKDRKASLQESNQGSQKRKLPNNNNKENGSADAEVDSRPFMTTHQKNVLIKSWNHHSYRNCHGNENIGVKIYLKLFEKCPEVKIIFGFEKLNSSQLMFNQKFIKQAKTFITVTDNALKNLEKLETQVQPALFALGGRHVKLLDRGFKIQHWDVFAESMLECIIEAQGIHRHRDTTSVWRHFISWMITVMKDGYYYALKNQVKVKPISAKPIINEQAEAKSSSVVSKDLNY